MHKKINLKTHHIPKVKLVLFIITNKYKSCKCPSILWNTTKQLKEIEVYELTWEDL